MTFLRHSTYVFLCMCVVSAHADDWPRFRGPGGSGVAAGSDSLPEAWSPNANLAWKAPLPGPGASSPIIVGDRAFVTCYSGYGLDQRNPGKIEHLVRHLVCIDMKTGKKLWQRDVAATLPEDAYTGAGVPAHGYASHTPVSDGKNVYAFFGKSGVHAFDMDGNKLWDAEVGKESDPTKWGSSSSPIVFGDTVIVTAAAESQSVIGFDKKTGKELWRQEAEGLDGMWGTPTLVKVNETRSDLVMCVAKEMWGLDPGSGKLRWHADATGAQHAYSSVVLQGKRIFAFTGRGGGSIAIDAGGEGNISETHTAWTGRDMGSFASPVRHKSHLYVVANGIVTQVNAKTGERVNRVRLKGAQASRLEYPSPIVVGNRMLVLNAAGQVFVFALGDELRQIGVHRITTDKEEFRGTPAVSNGRLVLRSSDHLYCVTDKGQTVDPADAKLAMAKESAPTPTRRRRTAMDMFNDLDKDKDGKVALSELEGNQLADRLKTLDKDDNKSISKEEFQSGIAALFRRSGGGNYGNRKDPRPDRPQRPAPAGK